MPSFRAHSLRFYKAEPKAITCLSHRLVKTNVGLPLVTTSAQPKVRFDTCTKMTLHTITANPVSATSWLFDLILTKLSRQVSGTNNNKTRTTGRNNNGLYRNNNMTSSLGL